jgi:hypothetical protein
MFMPVMDGWQFLDKRKRIKKLASVPVIIITGRHYLRMGSRSRHGLHSETDGNRRAAQGNPALVLLIGGSVLVGAG